MELNCVVYILLEMIPFSLGVSIARGKPTYQGTTNNGYISANAVDGLYGRDVYANNCAVVGNWDTYWTVDLQGVFIISSLNITNRQDHKSKLDNLVVEAFVGDPQLCPTSGVICGRNPGPSGHFATIYCPNNTLARYLRLTGGNYMSLCEVDVVGKLLKVTDCNPPMLFSLEKMTGGKLGSAKNLLGTGRSLIDCLAMCGLRNSFCHIINFDALNNNCYTTLKPIEKNTFLNDTDWNLYFSC